MKVLITGGAGFIGSHLADELIENGYEVRILDLLSPQVHGEEGRVPDYLNAKAEFIRGDVCDPGTVEDVLRDVDGVFHLAAAVGVGQSMYQVERYVRVNDLGTANLLQALIDHPVKRLVTASSMSVYGEGLYRRSNGSLESGAERRPDQLGKGQWEMLDEWDDVLVPVPTPETKTPALSSIYALSKYDQERMSLLVGRAYRIPTVALRFFNVYGPRQALSNPYTGVLAIFASRYLNGKAPVVFEDGRQRRDFVSVHDVARACRLAFESERADGRVYNIGSGSSWSILEIAQLMAHALGKDSIEPEISGKFRVGDIRHCFADISRAKEELGFEPAMVLEEGIDELAAWLETQVAREAVDIANAELDRRGLRI